jgi:CubicO group peptidase (beta-lactamase class C family)
LYSAALTLPAFAQGRPELASALAAIRDYGEAHRNYFHLPGMTLGLVTPQGQRTVLNFGYANADAKTAITPETIFQIGSISKVMVAAVVHQYAAEGRIRLSDRLSDLLPPLPCRPATRFRSSICSTMSRASVTRQSSRWRPVDAYPGQHWHYSNTAAILGKLAEHLGGKPLACPARTLPSGMKRTRAQSSAKTGPSTRRGCSVDSFAAYARSSACSSAMGRCHARRRKRCFHPDDMLSPFALG